MRKGPLPKLAEFGKMGLWSWVGMSDVTSQEDSLLDDPLIVNAACKAAADIQ